MRTGSAPNFCPPVKEGMCVTLADEQGEELTFEFLGIIIHEGRRYGFFYPVADENDVGASGEVVVLEVTELDDEGQPAAFELVLDEQVAHEVYEDFKQATKDLYDFEDPIES